MTNERIPRLPWCRKELGHVMLHGPDNPDVVLHRGIAEVEAESVALMVSAAHGLATDDYTIPYVASWASSVQGKTPVEVVQATAERVRGAAVTILGTLDTPQVGDGNPPGLDREALAASRSANQLAGRSAGRKAVSVQAVAQRQVETVGR